MEGCRNQRKAGLDPVKKEREIAKDEEKDEAERKRDKRKLLCFIFSSSSSLLFLPCCPLSPFHQKILCNVKVMKYKIKTNVFRTLVSVGLSGTSRGQRLFCSSPSTAPGMFRNRH